MSAPYADPDPIPITQEPVYQRDKTCPESYQLCPESLGGNCCPEDRSCGTSSCYATTTAPMSVCSKNGLVPCGIDQGGGKLEIVLSYIEFTTDSSGQVAAHLAIRV